MSVSDEEKRWLVVGISLNKVLAPTLRKYVEKGFKKHYTTLDNKHHLQHLTHGHCVCTCTPTCKPTCKPADLANLKYENIHKNAHTHGKKKADLAKYNYSINNPVDLAKLYLPEYMMCFSGFDDSLDLSAMLRLLGFCRPPIFHSPTMSIQAAADDVKDDVRNKWGHCNLTEWTEAFYDDCFVKLENLVRSLGLGSNEEKQLNDELKNWQSKGFDMCMEQLVQLVQQEMRQLSQQCDKVLKMVNRLKQLEDNVQEQGNKVERVEEKTEEQQQKMHQVEMKVEQHEKKVEERMEEHEQNVEGRMEEHEQKLEGRMEETEQQIHGVKSKIEEINVARATHKRKGTEEFDLPKFRGQLDKFYKVTMGKIQITSWDPHLTEDIHKVYTRLSLCREEKQPSGTQEVPLNDYTDIFGGHKKRIVVNGEAGIGKSTFSQRLAIDWVRGWKEALMKFDILLAIKLRDVCGIQKFEDILVDTGIVQAGEDPAEVLQYIKDHQDRVLILLDGYDEYDRELAPDDTSDVYKIITGRMLAGCHLVVTTRPQRVDEVMKYMQVQCKIRGFTEVDMRMFVSEHVEREEVKKLMSYLEDHKMLDMAKFPLLLLFLCLLWKERKEEALPTSRTELYEKVVKSIVNRWLLVKLQCPTLEKTDKVEEILCKIGKVAFQALLQGSLVFEVSKLSGVLADDDAVQSLGIFSAWKLAGACPKMMVSFIHKSMQEFLAAQYIAKKIIPGGTTEWLSSFGDFSIAQGFFDFFVFVCGLSTEGAVAVFQHLKNIRVEGLPSGKDFECLADFDEFSEQGDFLRWCFRLFLSVDDKESITGTFLECVDGVVLTYRDPFYEKMSADPSVLQKLLLHDSLAVLMTSGRLGEPSFLSTLNHFDIKVVSSSGVSCMTEFKTNCPLGVKSLWMLKQGSVFYLGIRVLVVRGLQHYLDLCDLLQLSPSLEQGETETAEEQLDTSGNSAQFHCFLVAGYVDIHEMSKLACKGFFHEVMFAKNLHFIDLRKCGVSQELAVPLARLLDNATLLYFIDLSDNPLGPVVSDIACCSLQNLPNLNHLNLSSTNMTEKEAVDLANNLQHVPLLRELFLSNNAIGRGLIPLAKNLIHLPQLENLGFLNTGVDAECRSALWKAQEGREKKLSIQSWLGWTKDEDDYDEKV